MQIFLSYRRSGDQFFPGRLNERLRAAQGVDRVFYDVDSIPPGTDFRAVIRHRLSSSDIVLILIGPDWEMSRLNSRSDFVRLEIETALLLDKPLLPVLIANAEMPEPSDLPEDLAALCYVNAIRVRPDPDFEHDFARLLAAIDETAHRTVVTDESDGRRISEVRTAPRPAPTLPSPLAWTPPALDDARPTRSTNVVPPPPPPPATTTVPARSRRRVEPLISATKIRAVRVAAVAALVAAGSLVVAVRSGRSNKADTAASSRSPSTQATSASAPGIATSTSVAGVTVTEAPNGSTSSASATATATVDGHTRTLTIHLNPAATWDDGTPITASDLDCTYRAMQRTTGYLGDASRLSPNIYRSIKTFTTPDPRTAVITLDDTASDYRSLFRAIIKRSSVNDCTTSARDLNADIPFSGGPWRLRSWDKAAAVLERNDRFWRSAEVPKAATVRFLPVDTATEVQALMDGSVDVIAPPFDPDVLASLSDPNVRATPVYGTRFENWFLQQRSGPFADPDFRAAFVMSVDRNKILLDVYDKLFAGAPLMKCAMWVATSGPWCTADHFGNSFQPEAAATRLRSSGWTKSRDGFWQKNGVVPDIRWLTTSGKTPADKWRADVQALMIPELAKYGFKVRADNTDANTLVNVRLKSFDYDVATYGFTQDTNPSVTHNFGCDEEGNHTGWCDRQADALMRQFDATTDEHIRASLVQQIDQYFANDHVLVPMVQIPTRILAWRTDRVDGPVERLADSDLQLFGNLNEWLPKSGDEITIGVDQWPSCLDPSGACVSSLWEVWMAQSPILPSLWRLTANGYAPTDVVAGEPALS